MHVSIVIVCAIAADGFSVISVFFTQYFWILMHNKPVFNVCLFRLLVWWERSGKFFFIIFFFAVVNNNFMCVLNGCQEV